MLFLLANTCLLAVFALATATKLRDTERARDSLRGFGVPERWASPALIMLVGIELLLVALLAYPPTQLVGAWGALAVLAVFTLAIMGQLLRGRRPTCACFGALTSAAISWKSVGRNLLFMSLAGALIVLPRLNATPPPFATFSWTALIAVVWSGISAAWLLLLTRQNGRLLLRLEQLEQRADAAPTPAPLAGPLSVGAALPSLALNDVRGRPFDLRHFRGAPVLLLFLDAACNHCQPLLAQLRDPQLSHTNTALVVISASAALRHDLPAEVTVLVDPVWSTLTLFGLRGTPAAASLAPDGTLAHGAVHGTASVQALLEQITP